MTRRGARLAAQPQPAIDLAVNTASARSTLDATMDRLVRDLRDSPTDLAKLVTRVGRRRCSAVAISAKAIARWSNADPDAWNRVREWLTAQGVRIVDL